MLSFFRKLSIGGKIRDGILPEAVMGTAEDLLKNQMLKTDTELKESVYGKFCALFVFYCATLRILSDIGKMVRHCKWLVPCAYWNARVLTEIFQVQVLSIYIHLTIFRYFSDLLRTIKDPEKPQTLEQLDVVYEDCIRVCRSTPGGVSVIRVEFNPTVPHCSLATLIGLCIRIKLERHLSTSFKLDIYIKEGAHSTEQESMSASCFSYSFPVLKHTVCL